MICHNTSDFPILLARSHTHTLILAHYISQLPSTSAVIHGWGYTHAFQPTPKPEYETDVGTTYARKLHSVV